MVLPHEIAKGVQDGPRLSSARYTSKNAYAFIWCSLVSEAERFYEGSPGRDQLENLIQMHDCPQSKFPGRRTLCLDMDDTLTYMTFERVKDPLTGESREYDTIVTAQDNPDDWGMVYFRPYLRTFLEAVSKVYEVVVFTAACSEYADQILDVVDPDRRLIHHRLYRESCQECTPNPEVPDAKVYIKDLRVLNRDLSKIILVDNSLLCFSYQLDNGIVCNPFKGSSSDRELLSILQVLNIIQKSPGVDVRRIFRKMYGLENIITEYAQHGGRGGIKRKALRFDKLLGTPNTQGKNLLDLNEPDFFSPVKATPLQTPSGKPTPNTRYPKSGIRTSDRHRLISDFEDADIVAAKESMAAPPIFINTILPRLEPTPTPITALYESLIQTQSPHIYRG